MTAVNGDRSPRKHTTSLDNATGIKRKRVESQLSPESPEPTVRGGTTGLAATIEDVFAVASSHDAAPAILNYPVPEATVSHASKRKRLSVENGEDSTVSRKVAANAYATLADLVHDIRAVCEAQIASLKQQENGEEPNSKRLSVDDILQIQDIMSFELFVRELVSRECRNQSFGNTQNGSQASPKAKKLKTTHVSETQAKRPGRSVLSLYGNAPNARQLFSSLQEDAQLDMSIEELDLPSSLTASQLLPLPDDLAPVSRSTFGDRFTALSSIAPLQPPAKQSRQVKGGNITFVSAEKRLGKLNRKGTYTVQPLYTGLWLRYGSGAARKPAASKEQSTAIDEELQDEQELLTAAYSSFAPTQDDSRAIVSADTRATIWWQRLGKARLQSIFAHGPVPSVEEAPAGSELDEAQIFQTAVEAYDEALVEDVGAPEPVEVQTSELLEEVNELLTALASYQRIRSAAEWTAPSRNPTSPAPSRGIAAGSPKHPSEDEMKTYRSLKSRLAELVNNIPPYVVAKLDGEQLEDLRVSKEILISTKSVHGVLEEDQMTKLAKSAAAAAAAATASTSGRHNSNAYSQYNRSSTLAPRSTMTPQAYSSSARAALSYNRSSSGLAAATPTASTRPANPQYGSQTAPIHRTITPSSYAQTANQQYNQRQGYGASGSPQPLSRSNAPGAQSSQYQPRLQQPIAAAPSYNHNMNTFGVQRNYAPSPHAPDGRAVQQQQQQRSGSQAGATQAGTPSASITNGVASRT